MDNKVINGFVSMTLPNKLGSVQQRRTMSFGIRLFDFVH